MVKDVGRGRQGNLLEEGVPVFWSYDREGLSFGCHLSSIRMVGTNKAGHLMMTGVRWQDCTGEGDPKDILFPGR